MKTSKTYESSRIYNSIIFVIEQVNGKHPLTAKWSNLAYNEYDFNDIHFYTNHDFLNINEHFDKYYEKLDFHSFNEVLTFLNKANGWIIDSIVPIIKNGNTESFLYTFYKDI